MASQIAQADMRLHILAYAYNFLLSSFLIDGSNELINAAGHHMITPLSLQQDMDENSFNKIIISIFILSVGLYVGHEFFRTT